MGLEAFDPTKYELEYIPQRLRALEVCVLACYSILNSKVDSTPLHIDIGSSKIIEPNLRLFIDLAIDSGLVANRTLLNFMGIKLDNNSLTNQSYALTVTEFGLPLAPIVDAVNILSPTIPAVEMNMLWIEVLSTASKAIAHFTERGATIQVARLGFASYATSLLVRKYFYQALRKNEPGTLIDNKLKPTLGGVWNSVDPRTNTFC